MFVVCAYAKAAVFCLVVEPVFTVNVVCLTLHCLESREIEGKRVVLVEIVRCAECSKVSMEFVFLAAVEIYLKFFYVFGSTEFCAAIGWHEVVVVG